MLIIEREVIKRIPVYVRKGKNAGKQAGMIYFERNKEPYYFVRKNFRSSQILQHPKHIGKLPISTTIIEDLKKYYVTKIVFMIIGYDNAGSFYIVVPLKDYDNAPLEEWDDPQRYVWLKDYPRIYPEQGSLKKFEV